MAGQWLSATGGLPEPGRATGRVRSWDTGAPGGGGGAPAAESLPMRRLRGEPFQLLRQLCLPREDLVIAGSAPLYLRGLRDRITDLDVVARGRALERVRLHGVTEPAPFEGVTSVRLMGGLLEIVDAWFPSSFGSVDALFERAERIGDLRVLSLADTEVWKRRLDRPKDRADLVRLAGLSDPGETAEWSPG
ncbi:hypothetical protein NX801_05655 [Streptomyces sp. LP05-1]|uniref:Uncharacterized protein n=1 Tax=Streptomyces pyxinae TaxID=2970734 RepID=A0ABT2CET5_9ACTN|nr:hypothetical protein [Streptomyces sp. LP05-1]MCS0635149.1 hypothetical protein [Streptomyces sp. LP05-1]